MKHIETLSTSCLNDTEQLLEEITAQIMKSSGRQESSKHNACSSPPMVSGKSDLVETSSDKSTETDYMFSQHDLPRCESVGVTPEPGLCVPGNSTSAMTANSPSTTMSGAVSDLSLPDKKPEQTIVTISQPRPTSKRGLEIRQPRLLWKRAILRVRIVAMLLPTRLKQKNGKQQENTLKENMRCPGTDDGLLDSPNSFQLRRAMFEKRFEKNKSPNKLCKPIRSQLAGQTKTEVKQKIEQTTATSPTDGPLAAHSKETKATLDSSSKHKVESITSLASSEQESNEDKIPVVKALLHSKCETKSVRKQDTHSQPAVPQTSNMDIHHLSPQGSGDRGVVVDSRSHLSVVEQLQENNVQTLREVEPVTLVAYEQSQGSEMADMKGNSPRGDHSRAHSLRRTQEAGKHIADGIAAQGDISAEMTDRKECHDIAQSQQQTSSALSAKVPPPAKKSASEPNMRTIAPTEIEAEGLDISFLSLGDVVVDDTSLLNSEEEPALLEDTEDQRQTKSKLDLHVKHKMLYRILGLPSVVQRSLDAAGDVTGELSFIETDSEKLPGPYEGNMGTIPRPAKKKFNFSKRIMKSLKISRHNSNKTLNRAPENPSSKDSHKDGDGEDMMLV